MSILRDIAFKHPHYGRVSGTMMDEKRMAAGKTGKSLAQSLCRVLVASTLGLCLPVAALAAKAKPAAEAPPAPPPVKVEKDAPYDRDLLRLAQILGSVHYLRALCNPGVEDGWRDKMQRLLDLEAGKEPSRRQKLTAAFNYGYRSFASIHADCTEAAVQAEAKYRAEGATLATEITSRFGN